MKNNTAELLNTKNSKKSISKRAINYASTQTAEDKRRKQRSYNMSRIRSKDTSPELILKPFMDSLGFCYHPDMYGHPDFASAELRKVVFVDGCFWHMCPEHFRSPKSNTEYWSKKINRNVNRDNIVNRYYRDLGWTVVRIWEHEVKAGGFEKKIRGR